MDIEKTCIAVQIDGKPYFVALEQDRMNIVLNLITGLSDNGKLNVVAAPEGFKFITIGELKEDG